MTAAALFLSPCGPCMDRQHAICMGICERHGLCPVAICHTVSAAATLLRAGTVKMIVTVVSDPDLVTMTAGRVVALREPAPPPPPRRRLDFGSLVRRWTDRGLSVPEIADLLDAATVDVRRELGRHRPPRGQRRPRRTRRPGHRRWTTDGDHDA